MLYRKYRGTVNGDNDTVTTACVHECLLILKTLKVYQTTHFCRIGLYFSDHLSVDHICTSSVSKPLERRYIVCTSDESVTPLIHRVAIYTLATSVLPPGESP